MRHWSHGHRSTDAFLMSRTVTTARWVLMIVVTALTVWLSYVTLRDAAEPWNAIPALVTLVPASVVLLRRDWHVVGWLLLSVALINASQFAEELPFPISPAWKGWIYMLLDVAFWAAMAVLVAVFPDGLRQQTGVSGRVDRIVVIGASVITFLAAFTQEVSAAGWSGPVVPPRYANPLGFGLLPIEIGEALGFVVLLSFIVATVNLVVRSRRATGDVRQQQLWVLFPFAILAVGVPIAILITTLRSGVPGSEWAIAIFGYVAIPIAFGVAMTRYRLYDIGRIISRTVTYTIVVVVLGGLYFGMATFIAALLPSQNALAVASATLAAAAVFNPLRKRIQRRVDRRFNRSAYQAEVVAEQFAANLRRSLTIEDLAELWVQTVSQHLEPASAGIWLNQELDPADSSS